MNYLPYAGYWVYGAVNATERASYAVSWGLLGSLPSAPEPAVKFRGIDIISGKLVYTVGAIPEGALWRFLVS